MFQMPFRWHIVTGQTPEEMVALASSMKMAANPDDNWGHSTFFILVDGNNAHLVRERQSLDDLVRGEHIPR